MQNKKQILITAATSMELDFLLSISKEKDGFYFIETEKSRINLLVSGVGSALTAFSLGKMFQDKKFDLAFQLGIAGSFKNDFPTGSIVKVTSDVFADILLSDKNMALHEASFSDFRARPFNKGKLIPDLNKFKNIDIPEANAITVNSVTSTAEKRDFWLKRHNPDIGTMEGAAFYYACMKENITCLQIRAISNYVGMGNNKDWNISLALENLSSFFLNHLSLL